LGKEISKLKKSNTSLKQFFQNLIDFGLPLLARLESIKIVQETLLLFLRDRQRLTRDRAAEMKATLENFDLMYNAIGPAFPWGNYSKPEDRQIFHFDTRMKTMIDLMTSLGQTKVTSEDLRFVFHSTAKMEEPDSNFLSPFRETDKKKIYKEFQIKEGEPPLLLPDELLNFVPANNKGP
jgi:hypothetical protein